jgi:hypothetical protein
MMHWGNGGHGGVCTEDNRPVRLECLTSLAGQDWWAHAQTRPHWSPWHILTVVGTAVREALAFWADPRGTPLEP